MAKHEHPGVFVEEIEPGPRPIEGVPTNTAALVGETERGSIRPHLVTSLRDYQHWFGDAFDDGKHLPTAAHGFFENGGRRVFVCRVVGEGATTAEASFGDVVVRAAGPGAWGNRIVVQVGPGSATDAEGRSVGFRLRVAYWRGPAPDGDPFAADGGPPRPKPALVEDFDDLSIDDPSFPGAAASVLITIARRADAPEGARPTDDAERLTGGADDPSPLGVADFAGLASGGRTLAQGLAALEDEACRDVALVHAPGATAAIARAVVEHCEKLRFRFAVIDSELGQDSSALEPRSTIADSPRAAFYYPWLFIAGAGGGAPRAVPPGGYVLGVYARTDDERGVQRAPANEIVRGAIGLEVEVIDRQQDELAANGVNVIRSFAGRGIRVWGARTLSTDTLWKYVSVRRLLIFLERSIDAGTRWVVFEPNDERLWARVIDTIRLFLRAQWRLGALAGRTENEAFHIVCDRTTMTQDDILNGRLICEIGIAPVRPAEFVIVRLYQHTIESQS